jgi:hypothetical protein
LGLPSGLQLFCLHKTIVNVVESTIFLDFFKIIIGILHFSIFEAKPSLDLQWFPLTGPPIKYSFRDTLILMFVLNTKLSPTISQHFFSKITPISFRDNVVIMVSKQKIVPGSYHFVRREIL